MGRTELTLGRVTVSSIKQRTKKDHETDNLQVRGKCWSVYRKAEKARVSHLEGWLVLSGPIHTSDTKANSLGLESWSGRGENR